MKQYKVLQWAFSFLKKHEREEKVAEILLQHLTEQSPEMFYMNMQQKLDPETTTKFKQFIKDHAKNGTPIQHIIGTAPFYGREFIVNKHVLIPRFETEEVVFHTLEQINKMYANEPVIIADLGTGSGIIAITVALELKNTTVYGTDISEKALHTAKENAAKFNAPIQFRHGDFLMPIINESINPHVIISNPPYIAMSERHSLTDTVEKFDPELALFAEDKGLAAYLTIVDQIATLPPLENRLLIFEIGYSQGKAVKKIILEKFPKSEVNVLKDINGQDRIVSAIL